MIIMHEMIMTMTMIMHDNNNDNDNFIMTTPLKGLFSIMLKSPTLPVKNPN